MSSLRHPFPPQWRSDRKVGDYVSGLFRRLGLSFSGVGAEWGLVLEGEGNPEVGEEVSPRRANGWAWGFSVAEGQPCSPWRREAVGPLLGRPGRGRYAEASRAIGLGCSGGPVPG